MPQQDNSTANVVMIILLVVIVGFVVWFFTKSPTSVDNTPANNSALEINLGGNTNPPSSSPAQ